MDTPEYLSSCITHCSALVCSIKLQGQGEAAAPAYAPRRAPRRRNNGECYQWKETGTCSYGDNCSFSHGGVVGRKRTAGPCYAFAQTGECRSALLCSGVMHCTCFGCCDSVFRTLNRSLTRTCTRNWFVVSELVSCLEATWSSLVFAVLASPRSKRRFLTTSSSPYQIRL